MYEAGFLLTFLMPEGKIQIDIPIGKKMFEFNSGSKKYRACVDVKVNNEYQIVTENDKNPHFPAPLKYIEIIDLVKKSGANEDEAALHIAVIYYCGLLKNGNKEAAEKLYQLISRVANFGIEKGYIKTDWWKKHLALIVREGIKYGIK